MFGGFRNYSYLCSNMKRVIILFSFLLGLANGLRAQSFEEIFSDSTLRLDYVFSGNNREQVISLDALSSFPGWYGRRENRSKLLLQGNGQLTVTDTLGRDTLYCHSFSTLFQEWQSTEEATHMHRSFENVFLVPMPREAVNVTITLSDTHRRETSRLTHRVDPADILIRPLKAWPTADWQYLKKSGDSRQCIDVAFVSEGYRVGEMGLFLQDCRESMEAILAHEPFHSQADRFNFIAVCAPSEESGVSIPHRDEWRQTLLGSSYDTFYSERYLTTSNLKRLHDVLATVPYEHIIILANTTNYGGGGIYNSNLLSSAHNAKSRPVVVHEFGHSFAGLADEYFYDDQYETVYPADTEPWEPNLTTLVDFPSKWADMLPQGLPVPTLPSGQNVYEEVGVYEGGGYQSHGVYRPAQECRMKINEAPVFCPVCKRAISRVIDYHH